MPSLSLADIEKIEVWQKYNRFHLMFPAKGPFARGGYVKHLEFFKAGAKFRERLFRAANRSGKCLTYETPIQLADGSIVEIGKLYDAGRSFEVWAWDGNKAVKALANPPIKKPAEECWRVNLASGAWFECAGNHRLLTSQGWLFFEHLRQWLSFHRPSTLESDPSAPPLDARRLFGSVANYLGGCFAGLRQYGGQLRLAIRSALSFLRKQAGVQQHSQTLFCADVLANRYTNICPQDYDPLSSRCVLHQNVDRFFEHLYPIGDKLAQSLSDARQASLQQCAVESFASLPDHEASVRLDLPLSLVSPFNDDNTIVSYKSIGCKDIYDFEVPQYKNYIAGGVVHHNTEAGAYEVSCHLTGLYPDWWEGRVFESPTNVLVAGETGKLVRDSLQEKLLGPPSDYGTGLLPKDCILEQRPRAGIADAIDVVRVRHISGGTSTLQFQSYDQGREAFQATARDVIWCDEEPPLNVYSEALTRTMTTKGVVLTTFTPLKGMSDTVMFLEKKSLEKKIWVTTATWDDAPHLDEESKAEMLSNYPPHQRDARSKGIPSMGSGAIYPVAEEDIKVQPFPIPKHWRHCYGMDVGWNNTAAAFGAYDPDNETLYITSDYKRGNAEPSIHASAIKGRAKGEGKPGVIDPASKGRSQSDGTQLLKLYKGLGLNVTEANNAVEAGLYKCWEGLSLGKIKVFNTCNGFFEEFRVYRRDEKGRIVKENDHIMDAFRYLVLSGIQIAKPENPVKKSTINKITGSWMGR